MTAPSTNSARPPLASAAPTAALASGEIELRSTKICPGCSAGPTASPTAAAAEPTTSDRTMSAPLTASAGVFATRTLRSRARSRSSGPLPASPKRRSYALSPATPGSSPKPCAMAWAASPKPMKAICVMPGNQLLKASQPVRRRLVGRAYTLVEKRKPLSSIAAGRATANDGGTERGGRRRGGHSEFAQAEDPGERAQLRLRHAHVADREHRRPRRDVRL